MAPIKAATAPKDFGGRRRKSPRSAPRAANANSEITNGKAHTRTRVLIQLSSNLPSTTASAPLALSTGLYDMVGANQAAMPSPVCHSWRRCRVRDTGGCGPGPAVARPRPPGP
ncbi:hypothetical protein ACFCV8_10930 [Streptomyces sp. NPDC056347]|uniref:hypothetical protein n=1 Tax=Streptomyces sp. NPDC056347 TaxID=3345790 RepID=UPI0035DEE06D